MKVILQMTLTRCKMLPKVFSGKLSWKPQTNWMRSAKKLAMPLSRARSLSHSLTLALTSTPSCVISALASVALALSLSRSLRAMSPCPLSLVDFQELIMCAHKPLTSLQWHKQLHKACTSEGMDATKYCRHKCHLEYMLLPDCYTDLFRSEAEAGRRGGGEEMFSKEDEQLFQASTLKKLREIQTSHLKPEQLFPIFLRIQRYLRSCLLFIQRYLRSCLLFIFSESYVVMPSEVQLCGLSR